MQTHLTMKAVINLRALCHCPTLYEPITSHMWQLQITFIGHFCPVSYIRLTSTDTNKRRLVGSFHCMSHSLIAQGGSNSSKLQLKATQELSQKHSFTTNHALACNTYFYFTCTNVVYACVYVCTYYTIQKYA